MFLTLAFLSSFYGALTLFFLYLLSFFTIFLTAIVFKNKYKNREPLILELPPIAFQQSLIYLKEVITRYLTFSIELQNLLF